MEESRGKRPLALAIVLKKQSVEIMQKPVLVSPGAERQGLEDIWRLKLEDASTRYKAAHACYRKELSKQTKELSGKPSSALSRARQAESQSLAEYTRVLKIFTELTVEGKRPGAQPAETC